MSKTVGPRVLLVDDEQSNLTLRKMVVESGGYFVLTATTPVHALELYKREPINVAVVDYCMPEMNGDALCNEMKRIEPAIPLILLSGTIPRS